MTKNVGGFDKIFRIILGLAVGAWGIYAQNWWGLLAVIPLGTALMGFCPIWSMVKVNTAKE